MTRDDQSVVYAPVNSVVLSCIAVAICAFGGALLGLLNAHFPSKGMAAVGGFYLVIAAISHFSSTTNSSGTNFEDLSQKTSGADNLIGEIVADRQETSTSTPSGNVVAVP